MKPKKEIWLIISNMVVLTRWVVCVDKISDTEEFQGQSAGVHSAHILQLGQYYTEGMCHVTKVCSIQIRAGAKFSSAIK